MMLRIDRRSAPPDSTTGWIATVGKTARYVRSIERKRRESGPRTAPMMFVTTSPPGVSRDLASSRNSRVARWNGIESE